MHDAKSILEEPVLPGYQLSGSKMLITQTLPGWGWTCLGRDGQSSEITVLTAADSVRWSPQPGRKANVYRLRPTLYEYLEFQSTRLSPKACHHFNSRVCLPNDFFPPFPHKMLFFSKEVFYSLIHSPVVFWSVLEANSGPSKRGWVSCPKLGLW